MTDDQLDEWTPEALANYDAAHARLVSTLDQFTAGLRTAMPTRTEGPELVELRELVDRALVDLDRASGDLTGEFFAAIDPVDLDDESDDDDEPAPVEADDEAGLGVSVIWRLDVRVDDPGALRARARAMYVESDPDMDEKDVAALTAGVGGSLQGVTDLAGMEALMGTDGVTPLGGIRAYVVTEDLLDGAEEMIDGLIDPGAEGPLPWTRERGAVFLPAVGELGMTEGFHFG